MFSLRFSPIVGEIVPESENSSKRVGDRRVSVRFIDARDHSVYRKPRESTAWMALNGCGTGGTDSGYFIL